MILVDTVMDGDENVSPVSISRFAPEDAAGMLELAHSLQADPSPCSYWGLDRASAAQLAGGPKTTLIARAGSIVVGVATMTRRANWQRHLAEVSIAVRPEYRRRGLARMLLAQLEVEAATLGVELLKALIWTESVASPSPRDAHALADAAVQT